jgi:BirA family biotin operon repressor/biotin-[acetyl-CoA-carboxylase] ligase
VAVSLDGSPNKSLRYVPLAAGIAAVDTVREAGVPRAELKWPNDILAGGRKLGGILCEVPDMSRRPIHVVVGLGLNTGPAEFPEELEQTAASFANFSDIEPNLEITAASWVARFEKQMVRLNDGDLKEIIAAWRRRAEPFGRRVRTDNITGTTVDLDGEGQLLIRLDNGDIKAISGGIVEGI